MKTLTGLKPQSTRFNKRIASKNDIGYKIVSPKNIIIDFIDILTGSIAYNNSNESFLVSPVYKVFEVQPQYKPFFIFQLLKTRKALQFYKQISNKGVRISLNINTFNNLLFRIPSLSEQNKIASFISLLDKKINLEEELLKNYQLQKNYFLNSLIEQKFRFKGSQEEWRETRLGIFLKEINEKSTILNQYPIASVTTTGLKPPSISFNKRIAREDDIGYKIVSPKNITINLYNILIGSITYNNSNERFLVSPVYKVFEVQPQYKPFFIFQLLKTEKALTLYKQISNKGIRNNLNMNVFNNLLFRIPSLSEQNKIASFISLLDKKINLEEELLKNYQLQKNYFLNSLII
ncbi:MAG: restriction endonuclease subunit S [Candidatus Phytoplasma vitis]|nr:MAG: restriction endonuclease subunit S [Candidatus Phytoplasma vitis]